MIPVGTPVTVGAHHDNYLHSYGMSRADLVVLQHSGSHYGLGPAKNNPRKPHHRDGWIFFSDREVTPKPQESKTVTKFKEGDKVEVFQNGSTTSAWVGVQGIVKEVLSHGGYHVELTDPAKTGERVGYVVYLTGGNLKLVEEPKLFTFKDIQVGDTIRRTLTRKSGATEVREGTVDKVGRYYAEDDSYILAYDTDTADATDVTLELLNRPEPEPVKKPWEDAERGTVIKRGPDHIVRNAGGWLFIYSNGNEVQRSQKATDLLLRDEKDLQVTLA